MADKEKEFIVRDRRIFSQEDTESGKTETAEAAAGDSDEKPATADRDAAAGDSNQKSTPADDAAVGETPFPEINFPTFVFSLNSSALVHLGVIEDPASGQRVKNLPMAKQTIDILGMLEEKTKGNLSDDEARMLKNILYELRMLYVKANG